jgi:hypothetical protein
MSGLWQRPNGPQTIAAQPAAQAPLNQQFALAPMLPVSLVLSGVVEAVVPHPQNSAIPFSLPLSPNEGNEGSPFDLTVSGYINTGQSTNVTLKVYSGTSFTVGSDVLLATSGAIAVNSTSAPFEIHLHMIYDSVSGKLNGYFEGVVNNTLVAKAALSTVVTGIKDSNNPVVNFLISGTSSAATAPLPTTITVRTFSAG